MRFALVFVFDADSARPRLVVRSGLRGRGRKLADVVLPARAGEYRRGFLDALLIQLRSDFVLSFDAGADAWYARQQLSNVDTGAVLAPVSASPVASHRSPAPPVKGGHDGRECPA